MYGVSPRRFSVLVLLACAAISLPAQTSQPTTRAAKPDVLKVPTPGDLLRGGYGPYRANNDLLFYHLDLRVDPDKKFISGTNTVRFKMLQDGTRIQLELYPTLSIDKVAM
ncbi:MAG: M1 family metallopeptidase, partial [Edaphobacter sp.]